jgi:hypothetical protein
VDLDLKPSLRPRFDGRAVPESDLFQAAAERDYLFSKRTSEIRGVAAGMEAAEVGIQFPFGGSDTGLIADHQRRVDTGYGTAGSSFGFDPAQDIVDRL